MFLSSGDGNGDVWVYLSDVNYVFSSYISDIVWYCFRCFSKSSVDGMDGRVDFKLVI